MAFAIDKLPGTGPAEFYNPANHIELADQSATSAAQTLAVASKTFAWRIWLKAFTKAGTVPPQFALEVADNSGFSTNVRQIDTVQLLGTNYVSSALASYFKGGIPCPDGAKGFVRIRILAASDTVSYDAIIDAV